MVRRLLGNHAFTSTRLHAPWFRINAVRSARLRMNSAMMTAHRHNFFRKIFCCSCRMLALADSVISFIASSCGPGRRGSQQRKRRPGKAQGRTGVGVRQVERFHTTAAPYNARTWSPVSSSFSRWFRISSAVRSPAQCGGDGCPARVSTQTSREPSPLSASADALRTYPLRFVGNADTVQQQPCRFLRRVQHQFLGVVPAAASRAAAAGLHSLS